MEREGKGVSFVFSFRWLVFFCFISAFSVYSWVYRPRGSDGRVKQGSSYMHDAYRTRQANRIDRALLIH